MNRHLSRPGLIAAAALILGSVPVATPAADLPRTHLVLPSAISVDPVAGTATLPLHRGTAGTTTVWYIVTDSSDRADAKRRGAIYAPVLANVGDGCAACVHATTESGGGFSYGGAPDFSPARQFKAGPTGFPPAAASPGATAAAGYTPFLKVGGAVINAPVVATGDAPSNVTTHADTADRVVAIDTAKKTVTLLLARGFAGGRKVLYLSTEASDAGAAAIERATFVPALKATAGVIPIDVVVNGSRQGLGYVALHGDLATEATASNVATLGSPLNVLASFPTGPTAGAYSPLWNVIPLAWSKAALAAHRDTVVTSTSEIDAKSASLTGPDGKTPQAAGFVVNCPVVAYVDRAP